MNKLNASMLARQCDLAREAETERDEARAEKQTITETAIRLAGANCCQEHLEHVNKQPFGEFVAEHKELGCEYCNKKHLADVEAEAAVMRSALEETERALKEVSGVEALAHVHGHRYTDKQIELFNRARDLRNKALSTTAGTDLLRELEALREVARLAESLVNDFPSFDDLWEALDKLK